MFAVGQTVGLPNGLFGTVQGYARADNGRRFWQISWDSGHVTVEAEDSVIDVEALEWKDALTGDLQEYQRCSSQMVGSGRRCRLRVGHRSKRHRNAEVSWTDDMASTMKHWGPRLNQETT